MRKKLASLEEVLWINDKKINVEDAFKKLSHMPSLKDIEEADDLLRRFAPFFMVAFPETEQTQGVVESPLVEIEKFQTNLAPIIGGKIPGKWLLKMDSHLPISGSVKARGGVYEVIKFAYQLAKEEGVVDETKSYEQFLTAPFKALFSKYTIAVGSTGNLGLSIGIISRALGFKVNVHMSKDAKQWKIDKLRQLGVNVLLYESDYSKAVEEGRKMADGDDFHYFIDDENSLHLFTGYAVAVLRLKEQLSEMDIIVNQEHPLFVYIPCGVGGAPGGVAYALKMIYGDAVHVFFAEPTQAPCMLLGLATGLHEKISINDIGIKLETLADGLAVGRPSALVSQCMQPLLSGALTVQDEKMLLMLYMMSQAQGINLEPSALAGTLGPVKLFYDGNGFEYLKSHQLLEVAEYITHISWATGGNLVPEKVMLSDVERGKALFDKTLEW